VSDFATAGHEEVPLTLERGHARDHAPKHHGRRTSLSRDRGGRTQSPDRQFDTDAVLEAHAVEAMRAYHYTHELS